jgi:hypothetical protein
MTMKTRDCTCAEKLPRLTIGGIMAIAKDLIRESLEKAILRGTPWLAVHELGLLTVSQCAASARLREMARAGEVTSRTRFGKKFSEWTLLTVKEA